MDPNHRRYERGHKYENVIRDYYVAVDRHIGELLAQAPPETKVLVVSDHGARPLSGGICVNEWLIEAGWLTLRARPTKPTSILQCDIDWSQTRAWAEGGYYARVFMNVAGREPAGLIPRADYTREREALRQLLLAIPDEEGRPIGTTCYAPEELYGEIRGVAPDLFCYFGDLSWRSQGLVGTGARHSRDNDSGPDGANHDWLGVYIEYDPAAPGHGQELHDLQIADVAARMLRLAGAG
jgi:predicted AlkP superfamily phosphohydrolase/phosphomutase